MIFLRIQRSFDFPHLDRSLASYPNSCCEMLNNLLKALKGFGKEKDFGKTLPEATMVKKGTPFLIERGGVLFVRQTPEWMRKGADEDEGNNRYHK